MNTRLALTLLFLAALLPVPAHAAKKNAPEAPGSSGLPSAKLEPFLEPCLDAILAPLEANPRLPRVEVEKLRANFAGGLIKAQTPAQKQIYQNAMGVCDSLNKAMDERANARSAAQASSTVPMRSAATGIIKGSPTRGVDAGANAEAIRKKQKDERKDADDVARRNVSYMNSAAYRSWTERAPRLRQSVMALYTRQIQLEALDESNAVVAPAQPATQPKVAATQSPKTPPLEKPVPEPPAKTVKSEPAKESLFVGMWTGAGTFDIKGDHTATRTRGGTEKMNGTWAIEEDGDFSVKWADGNHFKAKLSTDGQTLNSSIGKGKASWTRSKP